MNGDGFDDLVIGAPYADADGNANVGRSYVVFGHPDHTELAVNLSALDGTNGFQIDGVNSNDYSGVAVSSVGDIDGNGFGDLAIGAWYADPAGRSNAGATYVVLGNSTFPVRLNLADLDGANGFRLDGAQAEEYSGSAVSSAGDINGDGFDDLLVGAYYADRNGLDEPGRAYVVFGKDTGFAPTMDLGLLDGSDGFALDGIAEEDYAGYSVGSGGDVNGDGLDDLIIGARYADGGSSDAGESYVVFGKKDGHAARLNLADLDGTNGFQLNGVGSRDYSGTAVGTAGDMNGDGYDDLVIGAPGANVDGASDAGEAYVVFGKESFGRTVELSALDGSDGFRVWGVASGDSVGNAVSTAGDINGDGLDDLLIAAQFSDPNDRAHAGKSYLLFGKTSNDAASISPADLDGQNGFAINGLAAGDHAGVSVRSAGDFNGDGFDELIIGADFADANALANSGQGYLLFGADFTSAVTQLGDANDNTLVGDSSDNTIVGGRGNDHLVGSGGGDVMRGGQGEDILEIADIAFQRLVGGSGLDTLLLDGGGLNLDLTSIADNRIVDVERVDARNSRADTLTLDALEVLNISSTSNTLLVMIDAIDSLDRGDGWTDQGTELLDGQRFQRYSQGAAQLLVSQPGPVWQNPRNKRDVNDDGEVKPLDALIVINRINASPGDPTLPSPPAVPPPYLDVSGDDELGPLDALQAINFLNARGQPEGESDRLAGRFDVSRSPLDSIFERATWDAAAFSTPSDWMSVSMRPEVGGSSSPSVVPQARESAVREAVARQALHQFFASEDASSRSNWLEGVLASVVPDVKERRVQRALLNVFADDTDPATCCGIRPSR